MKVQPPLEKTGNGVWMVYIVLLGILVMEIAGIIASGIALRRWRSYSGFRRHHWAKWVWRICMPLSIYLMVGLGFLVILPKIVIGSMPILLIILPDIGYSLLVGGGIALAWCIVYTTLVLRVLYLSRHLDVV